MNDGSAAAHAAKSYYDSEDADQFYFNIWGGEDIHIGLYDGDPPSISVASQRTVERMLEHLGPLDADTRVLDLGAGYGGAARLLAQRFDCSVVCLNLSETQNRRNRKLCEEAQLPRVQVLQGNFEHPPFGDHSFDVIWSQDAILHSGARDQVIREAARMLKPGGRFVFSDPMQRAHVEVAALRPILDRIHLEDLASFEFYRQTLEAEGLRVEVVEDLSEQLPVHYERVRVELGRRRAELEQLSSDSYVANMLDGLQRWVVAGKAGLLAWGIICAHKPG